MKSISNSRPSFGSKLGFMVPIIAILSRAVAQEAPPSPPAGTTAVRERIVTLKDGSLFRGFPLEVVPGDHLTLLLATSAIVRIAWADIASQTVTSALPANANKPAPSLARPSAESPPTSVRVTLESDNHAVTLYRQAGLVTQQNSLWSETGGSPSWELSCDYPCGRPQSLDDRYRIEGVDISPSKEFNLPVGSTDIRLKIRAGNNERRRAGIALVAVGASLTGFCGIFLAAFGAISANWHEPNKNDPIYQRPYDSYQSDLQRYQDSMTFLRSLNITGGILVGVNVPLMIGGIVLLTRNRTKVYVDPGTRIAVLRLSDKGNFLLSSQGFHF